MAIRKEQSSYNVSNTLKTAMVSKNILDPMGIGHVYYSGGNAERHYIDTDMGDGTFRTIVRITNGVDFDFVDKTDPLLVRMWIKRELDVYIGSIDGVSFSAETFNGTVYTHKITYNGVDYTGTDAKLVDAICKALTSMINAVPNLNRFS